MGLLGKDLCDTNDITEEALAELVSCAFSVAEKGPPRNRLKGRRVGLLFLEASTRTRVSFQLAAQALGAEVVSLDPETASVQKGETVVDTVKTLEAEGLDYLVVRAREAFLPHLISRETWLRVINAGDGQHAHPTQALADVLALLSVTEGARWKNRKEVGRWLTGYRVLFTGDVQHSRVFRSVADVFARCGAQIGTATYPTLGLKVAESFPGVARFETLAEGLRWANVVYPLRVQRERLASLPFSSPEEYHQAYGISRLTKGQWLMHCGPMNRGVEVAGRLAYSEQSLILAQVKWGYCGRVALLATMEADRF
jgi:aspartate carbamoyltransferase catalytic subunit